MSGDHDLNLQPYSPAATLSRCVSGLLQHGDRQGANSLPVGTSAHTMII
jgi:hypothetical protein